MKSNSFLVGIFFDWNRFGNRFGNDVFRLRKPLERLKVKSIEYKNNCRILKLFCHCDVEMFSIGINSMYIARL